MADKKDKVVKEVEEVISETSENKKAKKETVKKPEPKPLKPYIHIDTFLQTAVPLFNMSNMQASGFRARMNGRHYQRDEQVFVTELKKYLNLK